MEQFSSDGDISQIDLLKKTDEFKDYSDAQISDILQASRTFAEIIYDLWITQQNKCSIDDIITTKAA